ncbi:MAG: hypothetical protein H0U77_15125 [Nocardioidaceae bacterium]|nr:hypothetical protein [Nocardioidaceae bacterium]
MSSAARLAVCLAAVVLAGSLLGPAQAAAQFLRLARSVDAGYPIETPQVVACRYDSELCRR